MQIANLFWTVVNLFPVLPLDGGQMLRIVLESLFGLKGYRAALLVGAILATVSALLFFVVHQILAGRIIDLGLAPYYDVQQEAIYGKLKDSDGRRTTFIFGGIKTDPAKVKGTEDIDVCLVEEAEKVSRESWRELHATVIATAQGPTISSTIPSPQTQPSLRAQPRSRSRPHRDRSVRAAIIGPIEDFLKPRALTTFGGALMWLPEKDRKEAWEFFREDPRRIMKEYGGEDVFLRAVWAKQHTVPRTFVDQVIRDRKMTLCWTKELPDQLVFRKYRGLLQPGCSVTRNEQARIVIFSGLPRPWHTKEFGAVFR
jgi:hypothetical protein